MTHYDDEDIITAHRARALYSARGLLVPEGSSRAATVAAELRGLRGFEGDMARLQMDARVIEGSVAEAICEAMEINHHGVPSGWHPPLQNDRRNDAILRRHAHAGGYQAACEAMRKRQGDR